MTRSQDAHIRVHGVQPVQVLAGLIGLLYLALGIAGFARTGFVHFTGNQDLLVLGFRINPLLNLVHVVVGVLGLLAATSSGASRTYGWLLFIGLGLVSIWGLMLTGVISSNPVSGWGNPLNLNASDNWLHIVTALLGLIVAIMPARKRVHVDEPAGTVVAPVATEADTDTMTATRPRRGGMFHRRGHTPAH